MAAICRDSFFAIKPIPRVVGKFLLQRTDPNAPDKKEIVESQFLELGWANKDNQLKEYVRGNLDAPLKEYLPTIERINVNRLVIHARHKVYKAALKAFELSNKLKSRA